VSTILSSKAAERLRLLESVVVNANDAVLITEAEPITEPGPQILYVNQAFSRMTGYCPEEVIGKTPRILQGPKTDRSQLDKIRLALTRWQPVRGELINYRKDGSEHWVEINIVPVMDETGWYTHWISLQRDITERKQVEEELTQYRHHLEDLVAERTHKLTRVNERLKQEVVKRKRAETALKQQNVREHLMTAITQRIHQSLNLEEILNTTVAEVRQFLQADRAFIYRFELDQSGLIVVESVVADWKPILGLKIRDACFVEPGGKANQQGWAQATEDIYTADLSQRHLDLLSKLQVRANLVVPIPQAEKLWGLLVAQQCSSPRKWQSFEINLLQQLAVQAAIAIQQSELYHQVQHLATSDSLTQVANRRRFDDYLKQEWQRLAREKLPLSLILVDVDFFKAYNDTYGHLAGDQCLQKIAKAMRQALKRSSDLVARYGGEEFAVILPNTPLAGAICVAEEIWAQVKALKIAHPGSQVSEYVTLSLGVVSTVPFHEFSPATLITAADQALYQAKTSGRDQVCASCYEGACILGIQPKSPFN
jgi:diguanylate cyclase (GGDEF)-like protein/PAS domain S-box-containing protein